jgi:hypothetical protein
LQAKAQAVYAHIAPGGELFAVQRAGVCFYGYLCGGGDVKNVIYRLQNFAKAFCRQNTWRASAEKDGVYYIIFGKPLLPAYMRRYGGNIFLNKVFIRYRVEIAIGAFMHAKRNVNVHPQGSLVLKHGDIAPFCEFILRRALAQP